MTGNLAILSPCPLLPGGLAAGVLAVNPVLRANGVRSENAHVDMEVDKGIGAFFDLTAGWLRYSELHKGQGANGGKAQDVVDGLSDRR